MQVFVYEHLSGAPLDGAAVDPDMHAAGVAMRDAVVADLSRVDDCAASVASSADGDEPPAAARAVRAPAGASAVAFVAEQARQHDRAWIIAPETGGLLARLQRAVGARRWLGCGAGAIALASSKGATLARAARHGLLTPQAFAASPETRRWVVKPDDGAGALETRVHAGLAAARDEADARRARGAGVALEPWVDGEPLSLSLLCRAGRSELLSVNRQQIEVDADGRVSLAGVQIDALPRDDPRHAALGAWARSLTGAFAGLRGYVGVDLVWHGRRGPVLIEVNPRVTMAYVGLSAALGRNLAAAVLAVHDHEPLDAAA